MSLTPGNLKTEIQIALLDEVVPSLRGVAANWKDDKIVVCFYNDGKISADLELHYNRIGDEIITYFSEAAIKIEKKIMGFDYPLKLPRHNDCAYRRKEAIVKS